MKALRILLIAILLSAMIFVCTSISCDDDDDDDDDNDDDDNNDDASDDDDTGDDDDSDDDDDDDDDDDNGPQVTGTDVTQCKDGSTPEKSYWPQSITFSYSNGILTVTHVNAQFNCCLEDVSVSVQGAGFTIDLYEVEVTPEPCFCVCPFDVTTDISGLSSGTYTFNVYANGIFQLSDTTAIP